MTLPTDAVFPLVSFDNNIVWVFCQNIENLITWQVPHPSNLDYNKNRLIIILQPLQRFFDVSSKAYCCYFDLQILHYFIKTGQSFQRSLWYPSSCNIIFHKSMNGCGEYPRSVCLFGSPILWCCYVKASSPFLFSFEGYQENLK